MELMAILGLGIVSVCITVMLRQYKPEYALIVSLTCSVLLFAAALSIVMSVLDEIQSLIYDTDIDSEHISVLLKSLGLCFVTQIASDSCRDAGETAIASRIEFAGRLSLVVVALPMFREVLDVALRLMSM